MYPSTNTFFALVNVGYAKIKASNRLTNIAFFRFFCLSFSITKGFVLLLHAYHSISPVPVPATGFQITESRLEYQIFGKNTHFFNDFYLILTLIQRLINPPDLLFVQGNVIVGQQPLLGLEHTGGEFVYLGGLHAIVTKRVYR